MLSICVETTVSISTGTGEQDKGHGQTQGVPDRSQGTAFYKGAATGSATRAHIQKWFISGTGARFMTSRESEIFTHNGQTL